MENVVVKGEVTIEERKSQKGNVYKAVFVTVNGHKIQLGFVNAYLELEFIRAGVIKL